MSNFALLRDYVTVGSNLELVLKDGNTLRGKVLRLDPHALLIRDEGGGITMVSEEDLRRWHLPSIRSATDGADPPPAIRPVPTREEPELPAAPPQVRPIVSIDPKPSTEPGGEAVSSGVTASREVERPTSPDAGVAEADDAVANRLSVTIDTMDALSRVSTRLNRWIADTSLDEFADERIPIPTDVDREVTRELDRARNIVLNARKIGELSRIDDYLAKNVRPLVERHPGNTALLAGTARLLMERGRAAEAFDHARKAAMRSGRGRHWLLAAANATDDVRESLSLASALSASDHPVPATEVSGCVNRLLFLCISRGEWSSLPAVVGALLRRGEPEVGAIAAAAAAYGAAKLDQRGLAIRILAASSGGTPRPSWLDALAALIDGRPDTVPQNIRKEFDAPPPPPVELPDRPLAISRSWSSSAAIIGQMISGHIEAYGAMQFGFILAADTGKTYYFRFSDVADPGVRAALSGNGWKGMAVQFQIRESPGHQYHRAMQIWQSLAESDRALPSDLPSDPTTRAESAAVISRAEKIAASGDYNSALAVLNRHLEQSPGDDAATRVRDELRRRHRELGIGLPQGSGPYQSAKRKHLVEGDTELAIQLYRKAAREQPQYSQSAIKDLAHLLQQLGRTDEAIEELRNAAAPQNRLGMISPYDNSLATLYEHSGRSADAITVLQRLLEATPANRNPERVRLLKRLAYSYTKNSDVASARKTLQQARRLAPYDDSIDAYLMQVAQVESNRDASASGGEDWTAILPSFDEIEFTPLALHFMEECEFKGFPDTSRQRREYEPKDLNRVIHLAERSKADSEASEFWLAAAAAGRRFVRRETGDGGATTLFNESGEEYDAALVRRSLHRFFACQAKLATQKHRHVDCIATLHLEAAIVAPERKAREEALIRFALTVLEQAETGSMNLPAMLKATTADQDARVASAIRWATSRSPSIAKLLREALRKAGSFPPGLVLQGIQQEASDDARWDRCVQEWRSQSPNVQSMLGDGRVTPERLSEFSDLATSRRSSLPLNLDRRHFEELTELCASWKQFYRAESHAENESAFRVAADKTRQLRDRIKESPTEIGLTAFLPMLKSLETSGDSEYAERIERLGASLTLNPVLGSVVVSVTGDIELALEVTNERGHGDAADITIDLRFLDAQQEPVAEPIAFTRRLPGGETVSRRIQVRVPDTLRGANSIALAARVRFFDLKQVQHELAEVPFSVPLISVQQFKPMINPYAKIAGGNPVEDERLFVGRNRLLADLDTRLRSVGSGKCLVLHGQKRAGKSSILYHLDRRLRQREDCACIRFSILELEHGVSPAAIADRLIEAIGEIPGVDASRFPSRDQIRQEPFRSLDAAMRAFHQGETDNGRGRRLILLIDEFTEVYKQIISGRLDRLFMKSWKALVERQHFSAVLVGQDIIHRFKEDFPNEFGVTEDVRVSYLDDEAARQLACDPLPSQFPSQFVQPTAIEELKVLTAWSPYFLAIALHELVEFCNSNRLLSATIADVRQVANELIRGDRRLQADKFDCLLLAGDGKQDSGFSKEETITLCSRIATAANGTVPLSTLDEADKRLVKNLHDRDVIENRKVSGETHVALRVGLFKLWLRERIS